MVGLINSPRTDQDDTEWPKVDVRNLIIDLDADIKHDTMMATREKTETVSPAPLPRPLTTPMSRPPVSHSDSPSQPRSQISQNNGQSGSSSSSSSPLGFMKSPYVPSDSAASADNDKSLKMKIKRTKSGRQEIVKTEGGQQQSNNGNGVTNGDSDSSKTSSIPVSSSPHKVSSKEFSPASNNSLKPSDHVNGVSEMTKSEMKPSEGKVTLVNSNTASLQNSNKLKVDAGTCTDVSTLTEPENLGPCEPGTSVNLEGIVWHETDTGVLVVNITWRGKTYVGTLLDCARHTNQWSAPRFTDSPEPGSKGRAKRNRSSLTPADMEPRKNLRSSKAKGKGKNGKNNSGVSDEFNFPAPSSPAKDSGKRKGRPDDLGDESKKRKRTGSESDPDNSGDNGGENDTDNDADAPTASIVPKREPKQVVYSYKMLECPRKDCNKQYKHDEGLRWHLSHSHPEFIDSNGDIKDAATVEKEEQERRRKARMLKEERRKDKENGGGGEANKDSHKAGGGLPPSKVAKLDDKTHRDTGSPKLVSSQTKPVTEGPPPAGAAVGGHHPPVAAAAAGIKPAVGGHPPPAGQRLPGQLPAGLIAPNLKSQDRPQPQPVKPAEVATALLDDLKKRQETSQSPRLPPLEQEKPPANSPAYSDISDDGDDTNSRTVAAPIASKDLPKLATMSSASSHQPLISKSSSSSLTSLGHSLTSDPHQQPRPPVPSVGVGPSPGTPEYHKYLAANGFPPFPYPYPVGMDPNYHVQLLKTDPIYKAKWEKDRAERERAFKEELDKDQGRYSGLSLLKDDHPKTISSNSSSLPSTPIRRPDSRNRLPEDLRKREPSGDRMKTAPSPIISVKAEFREQAEVKKEVVKMEEGVKPTMETRGPPPGPQTFGYMHPGMVRPPYSIGLPPPSFDPILTSSLAPFGLPGGPNPYLSSIRPPPGAFSFPGDPLRSPFPSLPSPEDLARASGLPGGPPGLSGTKALDLLQQHASQYYANQKLAELQERALKSPSQSLSNSSAPGHPPPSVSKSITTMAGGKDSPSPVSVSTASDKSKSPPPLRHVHTHTHTHIGLGYPVPGLPGIPGLPPVPGGLPPGALPPPSVGVVPASFTGSYPGKSP